MNAPVEWNEETDGPRTDDWIAGAYESQAAHVEEGWLDG